MDWVNRFLGRGVLRQLGFFTIINILIFIVCIFVYLMVCKYSGDVSANPWDAIRLFVDSNSITGYDYKLSFANVVLLITECVGTILFSGLIISIITNAIIRIVDSVKEGRVHYNLKNLKNNMFIHSLIRPYKDLIEDDKELDRNIIKKLSLVARKLK